MLLLANGVLHLNAGSKTGIKSFPVLVLKIMFIYKYDQSILPVNLCHLKIIILLAIFSSPIVLAEDAKIEGTATQDYSLIGGSGWRVDIDNVISDPPTLAGTAVSVGMATVSPAIPKGTIDPSIAVRLQ